MTIHHKISAANESRREKAGLIHSDPELADLLGGCPAWEPPIDVNLFPDRRALDREHRRLNLIDLALLSRDTKAPSKAEQPHVKLGRFEARPTAKGCYRHNGNFVAVTGVEADYDAGTVSPDDAARMLARAGVAALIATSASHGLPGKGHRFRVLCPLAAEVDPTDRADLVGRLNGALGGILSDESFTAVQSFAYGHVKGRPVPEVRLVEGRFLDECEDLDAGAMGKPAKADPGEPEPAEDQSENPAAVERARKRLAAAAKRLAETEAGENRNAALNKAAYEAGGFVACSTLEWEEVIKALLEAADANGYTHDYGDAERVIEAGLREGMGRPTPHQDWADMLDDLPDEGGYKPDADGAIRAFVDRDGGEFRYAHDRRTWFHFEGHTWQPENTGLARDRARHVCMSVAARAGKAGKALRYEATWQSVERGAQADRALAARSTEFDADPLLLGTPGGVVDLRTGELRDGRLSDMVSKRTAVTPLAEFAPERDCPRWLAFLDFALGGDAESRRFLQQWAGMSLTGLVIEQKLLFIHGGGGNGKGVTINTLARVAGEYAANVPSSTLTAKRHEEHPTELARLHGVRLAYASEVERGAKWAEQRIKSLTGGDPITARYMRGNFFTFDPQLTLTVIGNDRPKFSAVDDAIRRRFLLLEMDRKPEIPDPDLPDKLWAEAPGILTWMIHGGLDWQRHGLVIPKAVNRATDDYMRDEDDFARFLTECGTPAPGARAATLDLHDAYCGWASGDSDAPMLSTRAVAQEMQRRGFRKIDKVQRRDGKRGAGFEGFQLHVDEVQDQ